MSPPAASPYVSQETDGVLDDPRLRATVSVICKCCANHCDVEIIAGKGGGGRDWSVGECVCVASLPCLFELTFIVRLACGLF